MVTEIDFLTQVELLKEKVDELYIYGTGIYGRNIYAILRKSHIEVNGFVVTHEKETESLYELPVYLFSEIMDKNIGVVLGLNYYNSKNVKQYLKDCSFDEKNILDGGAYIDNGEQRNGYGVRVPTMEITTVIGCSVACRYCPQEKLVKAYYKNNSKRERIMSLETFKICLEKLPSNCNVLFSGCAEPFLNPNCYEMLKLAVQSGRKVDLYTTLQGLDLQTLKKVLELPLGFCVLHVADTEQYAKIPVTDEYLEMVKCILACKKENGADFVNYCNAQAEPDERVKALCAGKKEIVTSLLDRAGNLESEGLYSKRNLQGELFCSMAGQEFNHNNLLPDGTVVFCEMDYEIKYVLGNLLTQSYKELMDSETMQNLKRGIRGDMAVDLLCRNCTSANICMKKTGK